MFFFHDLTLEEDAHIKIHSFEELDRAGLSRNEMTTIHSDPLNAAKAINKLPQIPMGASDIIK